MKSSKYAELLVATMAITVIGGMWAGHVEAADIGNFSVIAKIQDVSIDETRSIMYKETPKYKAYGHLVKANHLEMLSPRHDEVDAPFLVQAYLEMGGERHDMMALYKLRNVGTNAVVVECKLSDEGLYLIIDEIYEIEEWMKQRASYYNREEEPSVETIPYLDNETMLVFQQINELNENVRSGKISREEYDAQIMPLRKKIEHLPVEVMH